MSRLRLSCLAPLEETGAPVEVKFAAHAVERYCERVRPALGYPQACLQLQGAASCSRLTSRRPQWASGNAVLWLTMGDDVAFVVDVSSQGEGGALVAKTCLTKDA